MIHNYADCDQEPCTPCEAYAYGYVAGKRKTVEEILTIALATWHTPDCGCTACQVVRAIRGHENGIESTPPLVGHQQAP